MNNYTISIYQCNADYIPLTDEQGKLIEFKNSLEPLEFLDMALKAEHISRFTYGYKILTVSHDCYVEVVFRSHETTKKKESIREYIERVMNQ